MITLDAPDADALLAFADGHSKIVAREAVELNGDLRDGPTVGSGPWVLERDGSRQQHEFGPNPYYYEQGLPLLDKLNILIMTDDGTRNAAFQTGMIDVMNMSPEEWATYTERFPLAPVHEGAPARSRGGNRIQDDRAAVRQPRRQDGSNARNGAHEGNPRSTGEDSGSSVRASPLHRRSG